MIEDVVVKKLKEKKGVITGVVVLDISGTDGGRWVVDCDNATITEGDTAGPSVRIVMGDADFVAMVEGSLNPMNAFFTGKLKIEGDMAIASKLAMAIR